MNDKEKQRARSAKHYAAHRAEYIARAAAWRRVNPEKTRTSSAAYRAANPEKRRAVCAEWKRANPGKVNADTNKRRVGRAMPSWANKALVEAVYDAAARKGLVVDHVIPLKHPLVCGLHVPFNLQLLTHAHNCAKGSQFSV